MSWHRAKELVDSVYRAFYSGSDPEANAYMNSGPIKTNGGPTLTKKERDYLWNNVYVLYCSKLMDIKENSRNHTKAENVKMLNRFSFKLEQELAKFKRKFRITDEYWHAVTAPYL